MSTVLVSRFSKIFLALLLMVFTLSLASPVSAADPRISIIAVKADELITVRTSDFPANVAFTVRMDVAGNMGINGIVVGETNSGIGGAFDVSYRIPAELRGVKTIAVRFESANGYYAYNWFNNRTSGTTTPPVSTPSSPIPVTGAKPALTIIGVKANDSVTVEARNLPASTTFTVRVGPYYTFFRDYATMPSVVSDAYGVARFTLDLPDVVMDESLVTVRIDGGGRYAFNAFRNVDTGTVDSGGSIPVTSTGTCQVVSVTPNSSITARSEFDAVWKIKNTSGKTWTLNSVDYKYVSGSKMQKYDDRYDLNEEVKSGETVTVVVDMKAPADAGWYTTNWALVQGSTTLCNLPLTLRVR